MEQKKIVVKDIISKILPEVLVKDLQENERICTTCKGLGVRAVRNEFGIRGDTSERAKEKRFPYEHQSLNFCPDCFNGVQKLCEYCGKPIKKGYIDKCDCKEYLRKQEEIRIAKWNEIMAKAEEVDEKDVTNMLYCEETDRYYNSVEDFFEEWECDEHDEEDIKPEILWVTEEVKLSFDAGSVLENACDQLHEEASEYCNVEELQELLDVYAKKQTGTTTYFPQHKQYIRINWERI